MDYDDNDFQSQNFQLVGEDSSKFPPSLRSFALPKFDFDEHLQVHLRFDSLVEPEVLLGIQSQENNWIKDFSPGSSAIEFGSSAAESCCISRRNNVWSEATSSESVEMLLKAVGEDEIVNNKAVIEEADMHDQLNGIDDQMDPLIRQDDSQNPFMGDIVCPDPTPLADKSNNILSGSDKDAFRGVPQVEGMSQTSKDEKSEKDTDIGSSDEQFNSDEKVVPEQHSADKTSDEVINEFFETVKNDDSLDNAFMRKSTPDDHGCAPSGDTKTSSECRNTEDDPAAVSIDISGMGAGKLKNQSFSEQIMEENKEVGMLEKSEGPRPDNLQKAYNHIKCRDGKVDDQHSEGRALNNDFCRIKDSSCLDPSMGSLVYLNEGCNVSAFSENSDGLLEAIAYQGKALNRDSETGDKVVANINEKSSLEVEGDRETERHSVEVSNENMEKVSHMTEASKNVSHNETKFLSKDDDFHVSTMPIINTNITHFGEEKELASFKEVIEEKQNLEGQLSDKNNNDSHNSKPIVIEKSVEDEDLRDTAEKSSVTLNASEDASLKESPLPALQHDAEVQVLSSTHDKSIEMKKPGTLDAESNVDDVIAQDISVIGKEYTALSAGSCGASSNTDTSNVTEKMEEASFTDQNAGMATDGSSVIKLIQDESVADPATVGVASTSLNNSAVLHQSCSEDALAVDVVVGQKVAAVSPLPASECFHSDENDVKILVSVTKSNKDSKVSSEPTTVADAVLDGSSPRKRLLDDSETTKNHEKQPVPLHPSARECSPGICQNEQQNSEANLTPGGNCDKQNLVGEIICDASNGHTNRSPQSTMPRSNAESRLLEPGSGIQSSFETSCGSPTVISCTEHSQDGVGCQEGGKGVLERTGASSDDLPHISSDTIMGAGKVKSSDRDSKEGTTSEEDRSFTFEVGSLAELSEKTTANNWKPFSSMHSFELPQVSKENSQGGLKESEERSPHRTTTNTTGEVKSKQISGRGTGKVSTSKRTTKETPSPKKAKGRERNTCSTSPTSDTTISSNMQLEEMRQIPNVEGSSMKASCSLTVQTSILPDLNTSVSSAALFHQPFTDLQQVQLRAQIFVYGSLIQGIPPDEACMLSAFGGTDGGRSVWEGVWRAATERFQNQKLPLNIFETPIHSRSGIRVTEQATKSSPLQSKSLSTPACQSGIKVVPSTIVNSTMSLPPPPWSISSHDALASNVQRGTRLDFNQAIPPLHSFQSSQLRQYTGNTTPLFSLSPRPGSWVVSSQSSTLDASSQYSATPVAETIQVTPLRDSSTPRASNMQLVYPNTLLPTQAPMSVSATSVVQVESQNKSAISTTKNASTAQKSRKRKKGSALEELGPMFLVSQPQTEPASATAVSMHLPTSGGFPLSPAHGGLASASSYITSPPPFQIVGSGNAEQRVIISEETCSRIEQSKLQAEAAVAHAAAAIRHSQEIWSQLAIQKKSGLVSEVEEKLVSAAVAAAAAASVAKVAAEAAKVASEAALQAKMVADEALSFAKTGHPGQNSETDLDVGKDLARLTPVSILKGKDKINESSSIISAAREAARRRVEAASAATKQAENLDAIFKAAELAAEAVSQAGMIIAMGDPLPFTISDLVEAGPEGYWKVQHTAIEIHTKTNGVHQEENLGIDVPGDHDISVNKSTKQSPGHREIQKTTDEEGITSRSEQATQSEENNIELGITSVTVPTDRLERDSVASNLKGTSIQKGTLVEVVADEDGLRGVWFSARVLDVKDGKAFICYNDLLPAEGSGQLTEWIPLESGKDKVPRIRVAHPITAVKSEGTRKRRREAVGNYAWAVGDRVDAWIRDGWWEGIVAEKSPGDETKLTIQFPGMPLEAGGDASNVRAWNLRPSLIWKDGQWILWSRVRERNTVEPYEGDTHYEKRQKLGRLEGKINSGIDGRGVGSTSTDMSSADSRKPEDSRSLNLSAKDKIFSVGKNVRESNSDALRVKRTGLQKEGSRVVFGVPKPGKKRKFMEVSKHYTADKTEKASEGNDSIKFAKYLMPQASRLWRSTSKVDAKGKRGSDSKRRGLKSVKSQNVQARGTVERENSSLTTVHASNGGESGLGSLPNVKASFTNEENNIGRKNLLEAGPLSTSLGTADTTAVESSVMPMPGVPSSKVKSSTAVEAEGVKGKVTHATDKSTRIEVKGSENPAKTVPDAIEPRRSNRRIQPTSRLLEGLQSSLIISKIPSVSQDRGARAQHRGASSSRGLFYMSSRRRSDA
ncbi:uncharacterized protein LOC103711651 isoform X2 [Phoenix dactylifera]|uniref:Uncharacterized protein LOC103711651 isoform X2 n=1 Tax=Phoenix dactylifera TaxID=42345 RepID=A0A8B7CC47_PHODC|nr:uncharacterized protein LOC103711651 isoform X2 [Phoenix dactylifera]